MSTNTGPTQLSLLLSPVPATRPASVLLHRLPPKLRVSARTRVVGREGIAEARAILAAQAERRAGRRTAA
jgi:hypothetical protein